MPEGEQLCKRKHMLGGAPYLSRPVWAASDISSESSDVVAVLGGSL